MGLDELAESLETAWRAAEGSEEAAILEAELAWCRIERGELGEAFRVLWEPAGGNDAQALVFHPRESYIRSAQCYSLLWVVSCHFPVTFQTAGHPLEL